MRKIFLAAILAALLPLLAGCVVLVQDETPYQNYGSHHHSSHKVWCNRCSHFGCTYSTHYTYWRSAAVVYQQPTRYHSSSGHHGHYVPAPTAPRWEHVQKTTGIVSSSRQQASRSRTQIRQTTQTRRTDSRTTTTQQRVEKRKTAKKRRR